MIAKHHLFFLLPGLALAACQSPQTSAAPELTDRTWELVELASGAGPITPSGEEALTANFTAEGISGSTGCNQYSSTWQRDGDRLAIAKEIIATERFCDDLMKQELLFLDQLKQTDSFAVQGDTLLLFGNGDRLVFLEQRAGERRELPRIFRGLLTLGDEVIDFRLCDTPASVLWVETESPELDSLYRQVASAPYEPVYLEVVAQRYAPLMLGYAAEREGLLRIQRVLKIEPAGDTARCAAESFVQNQPKL